MGALEERSKDLQAGGLVIFVDEERDPDYHSMVKILERKGDRVHLCWPADGYCEEGWYDLDWLTIRALGVRS